MLKPNPENSAINIIFVFILFIVFPGGCSYLSKNNKDMNNVWFYSPDKKSTDLIVLLPGIWSSPNDFTKHGFIQTARDEGLKQNFVAADSNIKLILDNTFVHRFRDTIIIPAKEAGYNSIWLVGISLGGFASMQYYASYPEDIEGVVLLSPYPGVDEEIDSMNNRFENIFRKVIPNDKSRIPYSLWDNAIKLRDINKLDTVYLSYGHKDDFSTMYYKLIKALPEGHTYIVHGQHDWDTWEKIWSDLLQSKKIPGLTHSAHDR